MPHEKLPGFEVSFGDRRTREGKTYRCSARVEVGASPEVRVWERRFAEADLDVFERTEGIARA